MAAHPPSAPTGSAPTGSASTAGPSKKSLRVRLRTADGPLTLLGYDTDAKPMAPGNRAKTEQALLDAGPQLASAQEMLFANGSRGDQRRILLILQGMDTSGKDGVVSHVIGLVGPAGVSIRAFKRPTPEEAAHHFLWRIRRALPAAGMIGIFNRSQYEDVLSPRVHGKIDQALWAERVAEINRFESQLAQAGTTIIKCFLHISYAEQRERLLSRLDDETKIWKFNPEDITERGYWSDYQTVYGEVLEQTSTEVAPWYIVPSDSKRYRNWAVGQLLVETLTDLNLSYPGPDFDLAACRAQLAPPH